MVAAANRSDILCFSLLRVYKTPRTLYSMVSVLPLEEPSMFPGPAEPWYSEESMELPETLIF